MSYIKYAFYAIKCNKLTAVLVIFEIASLLLAANILVSAVSDREMLIAPYKRILGENSMYVCDINYSTKIASGVASSRAESRENILREIKSDYEIYDSCIVNVSDVSSDDDITIVALSDEIYDNLALPLVSGNYGGAAGSFDVPQGTHTLEYSDSGGTHTISLNVTGTFTAGSYVPLMRSYSSGNDLSVNDLYISSNGFGKYIVARKSVFPEIDDLFVTESCFIIKFHDNCEENTEIIKSSAAATNGSEILQNTSKLLLSDLADFIPITICVSLIVLIGTTSISVIIASKSKRQNAVLWICGYSRKALLAAHLVNMSLILVFSVLTAFCVWEILSFLGVEIIATAKFGFLNFLITCAICGVLLAISMAIPTAKIAKATPIECFRRAK